jgi:hypothetical protein
MQGPDSGRSFAGAGATRPTVLCHSHRRPSSSAPKPVGAAGAGALLLVAAIIGAASSNKRAPAETHLRQAVFIATPFWTGYMTAHHGPEGRSR